MLQFFEPIALHPYEMALLRAGFAFVLYRQLIRSKVTFATQPRPVGLARLFDLTSLSRSSVVRIGNGVMWICLVCYVAGFVLPLVLPVITTYAILRETLRNSQGAIYHSRQACALILLVQSVVYLVQAVQHPFPWMSYGAGQARFDAWAVFASQQAMVAVYLTSGITKVLSSGWAWVRYAPRISLQISKSSYQKYYDRLDATFLTRADEILGPVQRYPRLTRLVVGGGLALELLSPLMLYSRAANVAGGLLFILFHRLNGRYMGLSFREHQLLLAVFFLNLAYGAAWMLTFFGL